MVQGSKKRVLTKEQRKAATERAERWRLKNRDKVLAQKRKHYADNKDKYYTLERDRQYRLRYGITLADYDRMFAEQGGKCKICGAEQAGKVGQCFAVDHCHTTLKVRGLLCIKCNSRLGWFERYRESVNEYLESTEATGL